MSGNKCFFVQSWTCINSSFSGDMDESLEHLITSCHYSKNFLAEVIKWFHKQGIKIVYLSDKDIMLGIVGCNDELFVNHVLLVAKQYLYYCRKKVLYFQLECQTPKLK